MNLRHLPACLLLAAISALTLVSCEPTDDFTPPTVRVISPHQGDTLGSGSFTMTALATDDYEMQRVCFWADNDLLGFDEFPHGDTYRLAVDGARLSGWMMLEANAVDRARNQSFDTVRVYFTP